MPKFPETKPDRVEKILNMDEETLEVEEVDLQRIEKIGQQRVVLETSA